MQSYAIQHNLTPFISMQNHYNLIYREEEREMMPTLKVRPGHSVNPVNQY
jgi:aryl-alcohol dehydrogenase-like predicted oxidoreductase